MKNSISDVKLDEKLKAYIKSNDTPAFPLDEGRVLKSSAVIPSPRFPKKIQVAAAALLLLFISVSAISPVRAAIARLFTLIPGVGIVEKGDANIYTMNPVVGRVENTQVFAYLENAIYSSGYLSIKVIVKGISTEFDDFRLYKNGELMDSESSSGHSSWSSSTRYHEIFIKTPEPAADDLYEIEIAGFLKPLSFTLDVCLDYDFDAISNQITMIPVIRSNMQNDISITTTANREENQLTVWCYPFHTTGDKITGIGDASPSIWKNETYIETESGFRSIYKALGQRIMERFIFDMPEGDTSAVLHIPYLTLVRDEKMKISIPVPEEYAITNSDISVQFSLGTVRVTEIERKPSEYADKPDVLRISFTLDSADNKKIFNSFQITDAKDTPISHMSNYNEETGCLEFIEIDIKDNPSKISFTISDLCYYLLGEYVIPLAIN